jgi:hypothetical protein
MDNHVLLLTDLHMIVNDMPCATLSVVVVKILGDDDPLLRPREEEPPLRLPLRPEEARLSHIEAQI